MLTCQPWLQLMALEKLYYGLHTNEGDVVLRVALWGQALRIRQTSKGRDTREDGVGLWESNQSEMPGFMFPSMTYLCASVTRYGIIPQGLMRSRNRTLGTMAAVSSHHSSPKQSK